MSVAIVGGGPAGLRAAELIASAGIPATVFDAKASVGRKFLVAGKGGLNLTHAEPGELFTSRYSAGPWSDLLAGFGPDDLRKWAADLGVETFAATTGRVYPREMKAAPLLRRWVQRLRAAGVGFEMHHRLAAMQRTGGEWRLEFETPDGVRGVAFEAVILALGGGSWPETGSDGRWVKLLGELGVSVASLEAANCGWEVAWPKAFLEQAEGKPIKNVSVTADGQMVVGELLVTAYGLEGGPIYALGHVLRRMSPAVLGVDLKPSITREDLIARLAPARRVAFTEAVRRWNLNPVASALVTQAPGFAPLAAVEDYAQLVKSLPIKLLRPRPIEESISSAGGVRWSELDEQLMIKALPGIFVAGEMIDWEAPTGGYLMQGCFATGTRAAQGVIRRLQAPSGS